MGNFIYNFILQFTLQVHQLNKIKCRSHDPTRHKIFFVHTTDWRCDIYSISICSMAIVLVPFGLSRHFLYDFEMGNSVLALTCPNSSEESLVSRLGSVAPEAAGGWD